MTPGRRSLLIILQHTRREYVAARVGVSVATVKSWCAGRLIPGERAREALWREYEIPCGSWGLQRCPKGQQPKVRHG
jgi:hypothetical protein